MRNKRREARKQMRLQRDAIKQKEYRKKIAERKRKEKLRIAAIERQEVKWKVVDEETIVSICLRFLIVRSGEPKEQPFELWGCRDGCDEELLSNWETLDQAKVWVVRLNKQRQWAGDWGGFTEYAK